MKRIGLIAALATILAIGVVANAPAVKIYFTVTADNIVGAWYKDGSSPVAIDLPSDANLKKWQYGTTLEVDLEFCHEYEIIFQTLNDDNDSGYRLPGTGNPGGFLAEVSAQYLPGLGSDILTNKNWQVSTINMANPYVEPDSTQWVAVNSGWGASTEWAKNSGPYVIPNPKNYAGNSIWYNNFGSISGISGDAKWIWTYENFDMSGAPGNDSAGFGAPGDAVFFKITVHPTPEPGTLLLLGSGLAGLGGFARLKLRRRKKV